MSKFPRSLNKFGGELRIPVDLDKEEGILPRPGRENIHRVAIKSASNIKVDLSSITGYLEGQKDFDDTIFQAISNSSQL